MAKKSDVSKRVSVPAWTVVAGVAGGGFFLWGRSYAVPNSTEFWELAAQPMAQSLVGAGAITAALLALHNGSKIRAQEREHHQQTMDRDRETNLRDRYTAAAEQLGDPHGAIREAGVHALSGLADDWLRHGEATENRDYAHSQARVCVHLLCSYLRANRTQHDDTSAVSAGSAEEFSSTEIGVRKSIVGVLRERLPAWRKTEKEWIAAEHLGDADRIVVDLSSAMLREVDLTNAELSGAILVNADLSQADLTDAKLIGANLRGAYFGLTILDDAKLEGADARGTLFSATQAIRTDFTGAQAQRAQFPGAFMPGAIFKKADLRSAELEIVHSIEGIVFDEDTKYSSRTKWPKGFDPKPARKIADSVWKH